MSKVAIVMGSINDFEVVSKAIDIFDKFSVCYEAHVISAHRTPVQASEYAMQAEQNGFDVIIAAAGKAAHLGGVIAAYTTLPVIGIPIMSSTLDGLDSLLSMVQMPSGVPVATVAINGAENAALLAIQIIAIKDETLKERLKEYKIKMEQSVITNDSALQEKLKNHK